MGWEQSWTHWTGLTTRGYNFLFRASKFHYCIWDFWKLKNWYYNFVFGNSIFFQLSLYLSSLPSPSLKSPFGSAAAVTTVFFLKFSCSYLVIKKDSILFTEFHFFLCWKYSIYKARIALFFALFTWLHFSMNSAINVNSVKWCTVHVKNSEQRNSLALVVFFCVKFFLLI